MATHETVMKAADDLGASIERIVAEKDAMRLQLRYAETALVLIRETCPDAKTRAIAAGAVETLREMTKL